MMAKEYVLIVGSGIHKQARTTKPADPLASWDELLKAVRRKLEIKSSRKRGSLPPSIEWEQLVADYAMKVGADAVKSMPQSGQAEKKLKTIVKGLISEQVDARQAIAISSEVQKVLRAPSVADFISLNFESSWYPQSKQTMSGHNYKLKRSYLSLSSANRSQLHLRINTKSDQRIWFPNGHYKSSQTMRLGLSDFGLQPIAISAAYACYKAWQRSIFGRPINKNGKLPLGSDQILELRDRWEARSKCIAQHGADTWVTAFMLYTPVFVGTSVGRDELGLWWLLCQRERDLLRAPQASRPIFLMPEQAQNTSISNPWDASGIYGEIVKPNNFLSAWEDLGKKLERP